MAGKRDRHSHLSKLNGGTGGKLDDEEEEEEYRTKRVKSRPSYNEDEYDSMIDDDSDENKENIDESQKPARKATRTKYKFDRDDEENKSDIGEPKNEEKIEDEDEDVSSPNEEEKDDEEEYVEDDDEDDDIPPTRKRARRNRKSNIDSDDSDFQDEGETDDDFLEKLKEKNFVATDEEDISEDYGYGAISRKKKRNRKSRSRSRSVEPRRRRLTRSSKVSAESEQTSAGGSGSDEEDSIQKEIEDLYDSSPNQTPLKHKLRERGQKVDYTIPPPIINDAQLEESQNASVPSFTRGRGRRPNINKNEYRKILFPTAGPFGGSDVISLFGTNIPPGGISIPGMSNDANLTAIGQNVSDSDTSEDEIAPINGSPTISKKSKPNYSNVGSSRLITGGSNDSREKKKSNLSDTDPLGVDMNIDFSVIGGLDNYINQLKEMVALPLLYPELYQNFGITPPRGVLFHGPPGTGKTLMARALAASCSTSQRKITFFMRKGADCLSKWVGEAERQLRLLFEEAKNQQPSIIFFDEIDGLAPVRSSKQEQIHASIVSTLLALMDGMDNRGQVIVIGATNRPDAVDPALRRPGRFDREFYFPLPDISARIEILKIHTRKWKPPLPTEFIEKIAAMTKGYGGADLRALCTEAALNSIQRKYPQIYQTSDKLQVNPSKVKVIAKDFMKAIEKIVPSSARSTSSASAPLPDSLKPLLNSSLHEITRKIDNLLPNSVSNKKLTALDEALYLDPSIKDPDGGFAKQELLKNLENARTCKPYLLICGNQGNGQQYISSAILNYLEGFQVQSLDMGNMFGDPTKTPESSIVQAFIEARRHQPSIIFIPNIDIWFHVVPYSAKATLTGLLRNLKNNERILLLGVSETNMDNLDPEIKLIFGFNHSANNVNLANPSREQRFEYFQTLKKTLLMKPFEFINDLENRPKRKLKKLKVVQPEPNAQEEIINKRKIRQQEYEDTKLKNLLKIKLAGLMDLFKTRYKRFKKPIIDENLLYHLFEPSILENPISNYEVLYVKSDNPNHANMIKELSSGRYYHNMDLDIIEERLWNGYYSEPKQFLKDIKMIVKDAITSSDRERILKANEMLTNAQFGIDEFSTPEFVKACKEMRIREIEKQDKILKEHKRLEEEFNKKQLENIKNLTSEPNKIENNSISNGDVVPGGHDSGNGKLTGILNNNEYVINDNNLTKSSGADKVVQVTSEESENVQQKGQERINTGTENEQKPINADQVVDESESELEEELDHDYSKELILSGRFEEFFDRILLDLTDDYNVEKIEIVMARFMDIIWTDRKNWDKTSAINKLVETAKVLDASLNTGI